MPVVRDTPEIGVFDREDFQRAWQRDDDPQRMLTVPETAIVLRRNSPHDFQDRQIYVWIDDEALGKIRYGAALRWPVEPGRHTIRVNNTLATRTLTIDAAPGEHVRVQCGTGLPTTGWLMMIFLHVSYLKVWLLRE